MPVKRFPDKLAPKFPNNRNPPSCSFASILIVLLTLFIYNPDSSSHLTIFIISFTSSLEIISIVKLNSNIFLWIAASVADAAGVNPNGIEILLANVLSIFPIKGNPAFNNGPKNLPKNRPVCPVLCNWVFDNFILVDEPFVKALRSFETFVLVNNDLCGKLFPSLESPTLFDERLTLNL